MFFLFFRVFKCLNMYQVGRNYFCPSDPVDIPQHKLTLWPGFSVSVTYLEKQLTLSADVSHKVLRNETVLDSMNDMFTRVPKERFTEACEKDFLGMVVLTRYNNKTYRVDDIDWSTKPTDTFPKKDGTKISYVDYYKQQYNLELTDLFQPMLVSSLKEKKNEACDSPRVVHLLPELCYLTGLSSRALTDFRLMKDLSLETQLNPERRQKRLQRMAENIHENREASGELRKWGLFNWRVFCILPSQSKDNYDSIKKYLTLEQPVPSQCVQNRTLTAEHDHERAIEKWQKCNNSLPGRIIIYRDGVGDGQLQMVVDYEIPQFLGFFKESHSTYSPKVTLVVVRKRCTTRFFCESHRGLQNPPLGTIIDSEATRPEWYDFFLISQNARQGSVNPTYYNVLYDSNCLRPDHLQRLTYKLCHLYYNWPGVIRVPAPCQYAHKLTFLVGQSIHHEPRIELSNTLYYL
ncbi:hypothetical protein GDO81_004680 [Engystomops pustulosus]|uniref:Piwi-like protein 4 n=1 Tax=Engystomops pustulosus TaxID=76066 RepID=A0AAV7CK08_ENGPU|nr:hypothetical protein GDO81_004680 [Engystomops pustulosus]